MKYSNDYEIVVEHRYYAVFRDGEGIERKIEIKKEVADALVKAQRAENNQSRYARKYTVSLDSIDYEGKAFASYDDYQTDKEPPLDEKVKTVLKQMKPKQARLLYEVVFMNKTQEEIAAREKVSQAAVSQRFAVCKTNFKKTFSENLIFGPFLILIVRGHKKKPQKMTTEYPFIKHITCVDSRDRRCAITSSK